MVHAVLGPTIYYANILPPLLIMHIQQCAIPLIHRLLPVPLLLLLMNITKTIWCIDIQLIVLDKLIGNICTDLNFVPFERTTRSIKLRQVRSSAQIPILKSGIQSKYVALKTYLKEIHDKERLIFTI